MFENFASIFLWTAEADLNVGEGLAGISNLLSLAVIRRSLFLAFLLVLILETL